MLDIKVNEKSLSIQFEGEDKLVFYVGDEIFAVGSGENKYTMSRGSFNIKEKIFSKYPLKIQSFLKEGDVHYIVFEEGRLKIELVKNNVHFTPEGLDKYDKMWFTLPSQKDECFYGTGEVFTEFNLKGKKADIWVAEHINVKQTTIKLLNNLFGFRHVDFVRGFDNYESYYVQPTFISSNKYFYHSDTPARSVINFKKTKTIIQTDKISSFWMSFADDFESLMTNLTDIIGRQPNLPDWVYDGQILGIQGGTDIMMVRDKNFYRQFFGMWIILVLQNVITLSVNLADNIMLGGFSEAALSGAAAVNQVQFLYQQLLSALGEGIVILGSQYFGRREYEPMKKISATAMHIAIVLCAVLFTVMSLMPKQVLLLFTDDPAIIAEGLSYARIIRFTYLFFCLTQILLATLRSSGTVRIRSAAVIVPGW